MQKNIRQQVFSPSLPAVLRYVVGHDSGLANKDGVFALAASQGKLGKAGDIITCDSGFGVRS